MNNRTIHPEDAKSMQQTADILREFGLTVSDDNTHVTEGLPVRAEIGIGGDVVFNVIVQRGDRERLAKLLTFLEADTLR